MFAVGDTVIYGSVGVCKISDITENKLTGVVRKYYVLKQIDSYESVIYVPVDNEKLTSRMRCVP
ncbi:MAG: CarD family transcriptional regulator, partial [Ruminococcus sp.]|nr:CarD family transcriptional regulator [Ruminococcus sp.]